jgi:AcrR family transcriptional regulator
VRRRATNDGQAPRTASTLYGAAAAEGDARERAIRTAYDLFSRHGTQVVGVDRIIATAGVAKMTLHRHFWSKDDLIARVLERRDERWTVGWLAPEIDRRAETPEARLLAIFDALGDWFRRNDYEGWLFINTLIETHDRTSLASKRAVMGLANVRSLVRELAGQAGLSDSDSFARQFQMLVFGAIVAALNGDPKAAEGAREVASLLLEDKRATTPASAP